MADGEAVNDKGETMDEATTGVRDTPTTPPADEDVAQPQIYYGPPEVIPIGGSNFVDLFVETGKFAVDMDEIIGAESLDDQTLGKSVVYVRGPLKFLSKHDRDDILRVMRDAGSPPCPLCRGSGGN